MLTDQRTPRAGETAEAVLAEMTLRFVRPDDGRVTDRVVETRPDGARLALAVLSDEGTVHYLWLVGLIRQGRVLTAMFAFAVPAGADGDDAAMAAVAAADSAVRAAVPLEEGPA